MKKLFAIAFALTLTCTSAFAEDGHTRELNRKEEPDTGGGGGTGGIVFIVFRGWCGKAHVEGKFDHEPSYLEKVPFIIAANTACDMMNSLNI